MVVQYKDVPIGEYYIYGSKVGVKGKKYTPRLKTDPVVAVKKIYSTTMDMVKGGELFTVDGYHILVALSGVLYKFNKKKLISKYPYNIHPDMVVSVIII